MVVDGGPQGAVESSVPRAGQCVHEAVGSCQVIMSNIRLVRSANGSTKGRDTWRRFQTAPVQRRQKDGEAVTRTVR